MFYLHLRLISRNQSELSKNTPPSLCHSGSSFWLLFFFFLHYYHCPAEKCSYILLFHTTCTWQFIAVFPNVLYQFFHFFCLTRCANSGLKTALYAYTTGQQPAVSSLPSVYDIHLTIFSVPLKHIISPLVNDKFFECRSHVLNVFEFARGPNTSFGM